MLKNPPRATPSCLGRFLGPMLLWPVLLFSAPPQVCGQTSAAMMTGSVSDTSGAIIAHASIKVTHVATGLTRETYSQEDGVFRLFNLPPGEYTVEVTVPGFKVIRQSNVVLQPSQASTLELKMALSEIDLPIATPTPDKPKPKRPPIRYKRAPQKSSGQEPATDEELIAEARKNFGEGRIAFKPPATMAASKSETFEARIAHGENIKELLEGLKGKGEARVEGLKVSCRMKVTLSGEAESFGIQPLPPGDEVRIIDPNQPFTSWEWAVTPKKPGIHTLHLIAEAKVDIPNMGEKTLYVKTYDYSIRVTVSKESLFDWAWRYWQWILGTLIFPLAGWLWRTYRKRKEAAAAKGGSVV